MKRFLSMLAMAVLVLQSVVTSAVYAVNEDEETVSETAVETVASDPVSDEGNDNDVVTDLTNSEVATPEVEETTTVIEPEEKAEENTAELETTVFEEFDIEPLQLWLNLAPRLFAATEPEQSDFEKFVEEWNTAKSCDDVNDEAGCVYNPRQYGLEWVKPGSGLDEGQVWMWKLVQPTDNPWEYKISIAVKWKDKVTTWEVENKVCAVVVIDRSHSMTQNNRWEKAKNWAIAFSKSLRDKNTKAYIWLVVFSNNAEPRRRIEPKILEEGDFWYTLYWTNIHDWLIKAKDMFDDDKNDIDCVDAKKYIVLLGDWEPNRYMTGKNPVPTICDTATCGVETIKYANELKTKKKIEIFSIWYETNSTGNNILQGIASTEKDTDEIKHFYTWDTSSVATAFDNIATSVINIANAWTDARVSDNLWASVSIPGSDARTESYEIWDITEEGHVYTFTVRIDPSISWNQATNDWVTLTYTDVDWNHAILDINNSASVNWILPECWWTHPEGNVSLWSGNFTQSWVNDRLTPGTKDWKYKTLGEGESLWACEWTCDTANWYVQNWNTCELQKFDITPTVTNGTINPTEKFSVEYGYDTEVSYTHNTGYALKSVTVDGEEVDRDTYKESYTFEKVTKPHTINVVYAEDNNGNGIPDDEEGTYTVVYTDWVDNEEVFATETYTQKTISQSHIKME